MAIDIDAGGAPSDSSPDVLDAEEEERVRFDIRGERGSGGRCGDRREWCSRTREVRGKKQDSVGIDYYCVN